MYRSFFINAEQIKLEREREIENSSYFIKQIENNTNQNID